MDAQRLRSKCCSRNTSTQVTLLVCCKGARHCLRVEMGQRAVTVVCVKQQHAVMTVCAQQQRAVLMVVCVQQGASHWLRWGSML